VENLPEVLTRLGIRLETLENRVFILEHPSEACAALPASAPDLVPQVTGQLTEPSSFAQAGATFPVLGKAMLGMAGAYVLRAVAESGSFPKLAVVALAIAYAGMWLIWAVRVPAREWFASTTYASTSALILAPMLWELTTRFKVLSPSAAAGVLAAFVVASYAVAWKRNLVSVVWVANLTNAIAAIALLIGTHDIAPLLSVLLLMALLSEFAASRNRWLSVRPIVAAAADIGAWALIYIYAGPESSRADYPNLSTVVLLAPACILLLIYGTSVVVRTMMLRQKITLFDAGQTMMAFVLAASAVLHFGPAIGTTVFGTLCLLLSAAGYAAAFACFNRIDEQRNHQVYATWSATLLLLGCFLCLTPSWLASCLGAAAIVATSLGVRMSRLTLAFHGLLYLSAAAFTSGLLQYATHALTGAFPAPPMGTAWLISASAIICYAIGGQVHGVQWKQRLFLTLSAILAVSAAATALVSALVWLTATVITPGTSHIAVIRTLTACSLALALAFIGLRWQRIELAWIAYATLALVAAKLLFEDLRQGHPEFIAASIFLYAVTLILVPRLVRRSSKKRRVVLSASK
jgi:hypothetical protein